MMTEIKLGQRELMFGNLITPDLLETAERETMEQMIQSFSLLLEDVHTYSHFSTCVVSLLAHQEANSIFWLLIVSICMRGLSVAFVGEICLCSMTL